MKNLMITLTLIFCFFFSTSGFSKWSQYSVTPNGDTIYIDYELVKKHNNSVFFYILYDNLMPKTNEGTMSWKNYLQFKCNTREFRFLTQKYYKNPMGKGKPFLADNKPNINFRKSIKGSFIENIGNNLCTRLN